MFLLSLFSMGFSFIKGLFSSDNPNTHNNSLSAIFLLLIVGLIGGIFLLNHFKSNQIAQLTQQNAAAQQTISIQTAANKNLNQTIQNQIITNQQAMGVVVAQNSDAEKIKKEYYINKKAKTAQIDKIKKEAQTKIASVTTPAQIDVINTQTENQISQVQIDSIWQSYCVATNQSQCPST